MRLLIPFFILIGIRETLPCGLTSGFFTTQQPQKKKNRVVILSVENLHLQKRND